MDEVCNGYEMKGNKPDFRNAKDHEDAKDMYNEFVQLLKDNYDENKIQKGAFGEYMSIDLQNDGPVTISLDSIKDPKIVHKLEKEEKPKLKQQKSKQGDKNNNEEAKEEVTVEQDDKGKHS
mgnify:CR=1 FL=1